jgi:hypothetical protein
MIARSRVWSAAIRGYAPSLTPSMSAEKTDSIGRRSANLIYLSPRSQAESAMRLPRLADR